MRPRSPDDVTPAARQQHREREAQVHQGRTALHLMAQAAGVDRADRLMMMVAADTVCTFAQAMEPGAPDLTVMVRSQVELLRQRAEEWLREAAGPPQRS